MTLHSNVWRRWHIGALLTHLALSIFFTWPLAFNLLPWSQTLLPGVMLEDRDQNLWNLWWVRHALLNGHNPFVTDVIWYPTPISLYYHTLNAFNGLLAVPLLSVFSLPITYNFIVLFSFVMGGYGAYLLVHYICGNRWAAIVGSAVFAYSAYHIATMRGLLQLISLEWVPFFVLFLLQAVYQPTWNNRHDVARWLWRRALPASFTLFLVSLVDWYYTMYALMLAGLLALYILARSLWGEQPGLDGQTANDDPQSTILQPLLRIGLCLVIYILLISPILLPTLGEMRSNSYMNPSAAEAVSNSADLLAFFQPSRDNKLWGSFFTNRSAWPFGSNRYEVYLTYTALLLSGVALFASRITHPPDDENRTVLHPSSFVLRPGKWFWAVCALLFFLLALGPVLQINGQQVRWLFSPTFRLPMPYTLIQNLPIVSISRSPDRFDMPLTLCLGVLSGYGTNVLMRTSLPRLTGERRGALLATGAIALIAIELAPMPYIHQSADIPAWYQQLGSEPGDFSILELPPQDDYWHGAFRMYHQTAHAKRIFGGYISREFPHPFLQSTPGYRELSSSAATGDMFADSPTQGLSALALYNTRYVVLQKRRIPGLNEPHPDVSPFREAIKRALGSNIEPVYSDDQLEAYRVPAPASTVPFLSLGEGWQPAETGPNGSFRWMGARATLRVDVPVSTPSTGPIAASLTFRAAGLGSPRPLQIFQGDKLVFDMPVAALHSYTVDGMQLPPGASTLTFVSTQGTTSPAQAGGGSDTRQLSFAFLDMKLQASGK